MIRRKTNLEYSHVNPDMTPMIDMVFILLIFVLVAASFVKVANMDVNLTSSSTAQSVTEPPLIIEITPSGHLKMDEQLVSLDRAIDALSLIKDRSILIAADKTSQTQYLIEFLDRCSVAGIRNIKVAVERGV